MAGGNQRGVVEQRWRVMESLHDSHGTLRRFQSLADELQARQRVGEAGTPPAEHAHGPGLNVNVATITRNTIDDFENANHNMVRVIELDDIPPLLRCEESKERKQIGSSR